ncbi:MAG: hypothetical protein COT61_02325 [Candidatus Portnoybacteria bacterium CG09_land_8_20_14_0_10_44_13]|uniref:DUF8128 domain-containing protein n=3 Tax=Candidatus Portnoyibacteriota TaxID=1817913 RepID=A0A2H0KPU2_9BACT|nr:MAG: hypothetical protein COV85_03485 [Candidatus Portnoybacteria bacterium CG11_big_fil_rev_8_21_14_0_20_44_10]PIS16744.1 MAG: hypothetical protein COT61_02325 [Candidatus Portnoybacteria bacterium CG09_land_8_20_14_0_10_44_13]PIZ69620.1 MAG: hypothetical protein COY11_04175 [Candidatus Portnoybacteria bacterium CG_4_10_14_0_2_um_filter_44_20]
MLSTQVFILIIVIAVIVIVGLPLFFLVAFFREKHRINRALNTSLFLITLPQKTKQREGETPKNPKEIISIMEQFYTSLVHLRDKKDPFIYGAPHIVFEVATPQIGEEISFYMAAPKKWEEVIEKQINGFFPEAVVEKTKDYNIFNPGGSAAGAYLKLGRDYYFPIKTYQQMEADSLNEIANALSKLEEDGEGAAFQLIIRPALDGWRRPGLKIAKKMQEGKSYEQARQDLWAFGFWEAFQSAKASKKQKEDDRQKPVVSVTPLQEEIIKSLDGKISKVGFEANLRILVSARTQLRAESLLSQMEGAFAQFTTPHLNFLRSRRLKGRALKNLIYNFSFRLFDVSQKNILNSEELTGLFHFPIIPLEAPKIKTLKAKSAPPPANLPKEGLVLGRNFFRGAETVARLEDDDRRRHFYIIGQTGTGKSAFLQNMIQQDIANGRGVAVLDPHGDLIEKILGLIPKERAEDVVVCDPADMERPLGLNMLEYDFSHPEQKTFIVNELINIFDKLYDMKVAGGPMFEQYARNALLLLMDDPTESATLMEVPRVMADRVYRQRLLSKCRNVIVKDFWEKEAEKAGGEASLANMVPYITSKFNTFIANDYMRPIIGQAKSTLNFREIIDGGKIFLINLSKGRLGELNSSLLGLIVVGKILMASFARIDQPEKERKDFYLYMDEFQNFTTESIETALSEARKYRLCLTITHQFIGQLPEKIRNAVFGNVGSIASFRIGAEDAEFVAKQFAPVFDENDLINIDNYNAYLKLLVRGATTKPFNVITYPPAEENFEIAHSVKQLSRLKYGKDRNLVEEEIYGRWREYE